MPGVGERQHAVRPLLEAAAAACDRGDWSSALAIAEAAAALDPNDPAVVRALARATSGPGTAARRRLTVMFCDLAGSTEIASALDPEDTRELLQAYYDACGEIVRQHDGHVARLMGDGVLIYFGYPRAHEDDGMRAVLTAVAITDKVSRLRSPATGAIGKLQVRIGIHTGLAVVSDLGSGAWASPGEIVGETPNLASRVQTAAAAGTIVISGATLGLVRDRVQVKGLGARSLKGINRPVELYEVVSVRHDEDEVAGAVSDAVAVGREIERATLERAWQEASHRSSYLVIAGEPGIGKSHLVRYARSLVREPGRSLVLRCSLLHSNTPLHPVAQRLLPAPGELGRRQEHRHPLDRLARIAESVGLNSEENLYLLALMSSVPWPAGREVPDIQPEQARVRTLTLLCAWFDALAANGPLLLVAEDLHWADPSTLELLRRYVAEPRPHPILVLVTTRLEPDTVPGEPSTVISLRALEATECDELIDKLAGGRLDQATRIRVAERGNGVPLFVRELATMLDGGDTPGSDSAPRSVPPTLNDLLVARLDSFPNQRELIEALAVLGRPASRELVAEVTSRAPIDVQQELDQLERGGILRFSPAPPQYDFHHVLLRDAAYDVQIRARRRELHRRAAEVLQATYSMSHDDPQELAHHYQLAGELGTAVTLWMRAALRQASFAAHAEAIQSFELVLSHLPQLDGEVGDLELQAQSGLAASLLASRGYTAPEVAEAYAKVRELSIARDAELEVPGLYGLWAYYHVTGEAPISLETAEALLDRAARSEDDQTAAAARAVLGYQLQRLGRPPEALALLEQGRQWDCPEPLFPHHPGIGAGANLAMTQWLVGDFAAARTSIEEAVAAAELLEGPTAHFTRAYTHAFAAELFQVAGQPKIASVHAGRTVQVSDEYGFASWLGAGMANLKIAEVLCGDLDAIPTIEYCVNAWRSAGASSSLTQFGLGLALAYRAAGRVEDALMTIDRALHDAVEIQELYLEPELHRVRGELLTQLQRNESGLEALEQALATAALSGSRALELRALLSIERCHRDQGDAQSTVDEIGLLLGRLDPGGQDPEPLLIHARELIER